MAVQKPLFPGVSINSILLILLASISMYVSGFNVSLAFQPLIPPAIEALSQALFGALTFTALFNACGAHDEGYRNSFGAFLSISIITLITTVIFGENGVQLGDSSSTYKMLVDFVASSAIFLYTFGFTMRFIGWIRSAFCIILASLIMFVVEVGVRSIISYVLI